MIEHGPSLAVAVSRPLIAMTVAVHMAKKGSEARALPTMQEMASHLSVLEEVPRRLTIEGGAVGWRKMTDIISRGTMDKMGIRTPEK